MFVLLGCSLVLENTFHVYSSGFNLWHHPKMSALIAMHLNFVLCTYLENLFSLSFSALTNILTYYWLPMSGLRGV